MARPRGSILIAAVSGRALAQATAAAGFVPLVADFFADVDTRAIAGACRKMPGNIRDGFQWAHLAPALGELAAEAHVPLLGLVYGSGFEDRPELLSNIAVRWLLLGNSAEAVTRINNPAHFFALLDELAIAHPETRADLPRSQSGWIAKRRGGAGGSHVAAGPMGGHDPNAYYQAFISGRTISALILGNGREAQVLGFSEQWQAPAPGKPWRYGGAVQPAALPDGLAEAIAGAMDRLVSACEIRGLASADFILSGQTPYLLEINPRPGATLDIFADAETPLMGLHVAAILDRKIPAAPLRCERASASTILFAPSPFVVPHAMMWPSWAADLPVHGECIDKQRPICTVRGSAASAEQARCLAESRKAHLLAKIQSLAQEEQRGRIKSENEKTKSQHASHTDSARHY